MVRSWLCLHGKATARNLHRATVGYVGRAGPGPAGRAHPPPAHPGGGGCLPPGPEHRPPLRPQGGQPWEYQTATALEALFGWLYLQGRTDRLNQLFSTMMEGGSCDPPNL